MYINPPVCHKQCLLALSNSDPIKRSLALGKCVAIYHTHTHMHGPLDAHFPPPLGPRGTENAFPKKAPQLEHLPNGTLQSSTYAGYGYTAYSQRPRLSFVLSRGKAAPLVATSLGEC